MLTIEAERGNRSSPLLPLLAVYLGTVQFVTAPQKLTLK